MFFATPFERRSIDKYYLLNAGIHSLSRFGDDWFGAAVVQNFRWPQMTQIDIEGRVVR